MANKQQRGTADAPRMPRRRSTAAAIAATHEHTVPTLAADDADLLAATTTWPAPTTRSRRAANATGQPPRAGRDTTGERPTPARRATGEHPRTAGGRSGEHPNAGRAVRVAAIEAVPTQAITAERRATGATNRAAGKATRATAAQRTPTAEHSTALHPTAERPTASGPRVARQAPTPASSAPGRPTIGLPAIPNDRVPVAALGPEARQVAPKRGATPPAVLIRGAKNPARRYGPIVPRRSRERSFAVRFIMSMVVAVAVVSAVVLITPLGQTAGITTTFDAYANAVPWVPTPTPVPPTPTPRPAVPAGPSHYASPGTQAIINEIEAVFGQYATGALNIARCESGYDPNAWNGYPVLGSHASGVFQILYPITWNGTPYAGDSPYNADANIHAAYWIFQKDGYSWREWACKSY